MDLEYTFLNGILEGEVYIEQPEGFFDANKKNMVCRLHKSLYGLKEAPRVWNEKLHNYLVKIDFEKTDDKNNLYLNT